MARVCRELDVQLFLMDGASLFGSAGSVAGAAEEAMRNKFAEARACTKPAVLFIDEIVRQATHTHEARCRAAASFSSQSDSQIVLFVFLFQDVLCPARTEGGGLSTRLVAQLLSLMDGLENRGHLIIVGATNQ